MGLFSLDWVSHPLLAGYVYWIMDAISRKSVKKGTKNIRLLSLPFSKNKKKLRILNDWSVYLKLNFKGPTQNHPKKWFIGKLNRYYISIHFPYLIKKFQCFSSTLKNHQVCLNIWQKNEEKPPHSTCYWNLFLYNNP